MMEPRRVRRARAAATHRLSPARGENGSRFGGMGWVVLGGVVLALAAFFYFGPVRGPASASGNTSDHHDDARIKLVAGTVAPDLSLPDVSGSTFRLSDALSKSNVLLFFHEGVACPACFQQMRDLQREDARLQALDTSLVSITADPMSELKAGAVREKVVGMPLLSDSNLAASRAFDALYVSMHPGQVPGHTFILLDRSRKVLWRQDYQEMYVPVDQVLAAVARGLGR